MPVFAEEELTISTGQVSGGDLREHLTTIANPIVLNEDLQNDLDDRMSKYQAPEESLIKNRAEQFYYYEHLEPEEKQMYDVIQTVASDPTDDNNIGLLMTTVDPASNDFSYHFARAFFSLLNDHPEFFWLYTMDDILINYSYETSSVNGIYFAYVYLNQPYAEFEEQMKAFNAAADQFLADIDTSVSKYEIVRQVHDKLLREVAYNHPVADDSRNNDLAHTAYGALVEDSLGNANAPVCDGYSLAMEYLLQQCGIPVLVVCGDAGDNALSAGGHAWNMVELDGKWYELDATWDDYQDNEQFLDPSEQGYEYFLQAYHDEQYMDKITHYLFLVSTSTISEFSPDDAYTYYFSDGAYLTLLGRSVHRRWGTNGEINPYMAQPSVFNMTPVAESNY